MDTLSSFTDVLDDVICDSQPMSLPSSIESNTACLTEKDINTVVADRPPKRTAQCGHFRSTQEIDPKYRDVFTYPYFNLIQSSVIDDALYSDKSIVVCAPTGSGKTVVFEMAIVQLLMELEDKNYNEDFKIIYMAPVKALCTERLTEWYPKFTKLGLLCIEATGDTDVDFAQLKPYKIIITTPEKWDILTRRWRDHRNLVEVIKLFLIDEVHILNDESRGPVLEAVVSRMKTIESSAQAVHRIELLQNQLHGTEMTHKTAPNIRFVAVSATIANTEDVASWLGTDKKPAVFHKFGDECRPVKLKRVVEGYHCPAGTSIFKFDIILNYKLWPIIQKYHSGKPTLIFCNTRKSVILTAETLSRELTINFNAEQKAKLTALASTIKNKKIQSLVMSGVGCHHAGLLYEERQVIENAFRNRDLPILITTTTLAMGVNLPAHLVIIKNTQQYVNGAYQEYSISTVLQMIGRAGRPQFDTDATAVIMTRLADKARYQALVGGCEPLQSYLHKRLPENLNSEAALGTVGDVAQCVQWLRSTFLYVRASRDPKKYLNLPQNSPQHLITKKIEELCVKAMNSLASSGLINMDEACCIESTEAGRLMSIFYLDLETMKLLMKIEGTETLERLLTLICESHELSDMHLRVDERRCLNTLNRNNTGVTIRFQMKGKISTRQMKLNCIIQAVLGCIAIPDPSLNQEAMKIMRIADRVCKCLVAYVTRPDLISHQPQFYLAVKDSIILAKCITAHLWENSPFISKQLKGIGPTFSTLLASAGKVNFMLLEESHPRDLERIMNKGAPAGNVLRKQISLLPKYQISLVPVDESTVTLQLVLLNQTYLSENIEELTAGSSHKSYIVVGDSDNHILLLASFKDKDLICVFDGTISHEIRRKNCKKHKIFAHCISSTFVGIDVQSEYLFNDQTIFFETVPTSLKANKKHNVNEVLKQTYIEDTFKNRKRKCSIESDKVQSKEKKKRGNAILENFKYVKNTFETASKNVMNLGRSTKTNALQNYTIDNLPEKPLIFNSKRLKENNVKDEIDFSKIEDHILSDHIDNNDFIDDDKVDSILIEIENEMSKHKGRSKESHSLLSNNFDQKVKTENTLINFYKESINKATIPFKKDSLKTINAKKRKPLNSKSNYSVIELIERNLTDESDEGIIIPNNNGFSETVKSHINEYIQEAQSKTKTLATDKLNLLLHNLENTNENNVSNDNTCTISDEKYSLLSGQCLSPHYEMKEILRGDDDTLKTINYEEKTKDLPRHLIAHSQENSNFNKHDNELIMPSNNKLNGTSYETSEIYRTPVNESDVNELHITKGICKSLQVCQEANMHDTRPYKTKYSDSASLIETGVNKSLTTQEYNSICVNEYQNTRKQFLDHTFECCNSTNTNINNTNDIMEIKQNTITQLIIPKELCASRQFYCEMTTEQEQKLYVSTKQNDNSNSFSLNKTSFLQPNHTYQGKSQLNVTKSITVSNRGSYNHNAISENIELSQNKKGTILNNAILNDDDIILSNGTHKLLSASYFSNNSVVAHSSKSNNILSNVKDYNGGKQKSEASDRNVMNYIKNYLHTETKIEISSKQLPICSIQDVQKVKMDLNITEIITFQSQNENILLKPKFKENSDDMKEIVCCKSINLSYNLPNYYQHIRDTKTINKNDLKQKNKTENQKYHQQPNSVTTAKKIDIAPYIKSHMQKQDLYSSQGLEITGDSTDVSEMEPKGPSLNNLRDVMKLHERSKTLELCDTASKIENTNVKNILQKYSNILRPGAAKGQILSNSISFRNNAHKKTSLKKSQKPFKICDIQKMQALPESIINYNNQHFQHNLESVKTIIDVKSTNTMHTQSEQYRQCNGDIVDNVVSNEITIKDLKPIHIANQVDLVADPDYKLDVSMFDPKALLQSAVNNNEQEIIPPPVQFSDNFTPPFHYLYEDVTDCTVANDYRHCEDLQTQFRYNANLDYTSNVFEDNSINNVTSSEIEACSLELQDYSEHDFSYSSPVKSLPVTRSNNNFDTPKNSKFSRQVRLGQFKFNGKNKLRKWK